MKSRNRTIDVIRGFAMLLVVLGHTVSGSTIEYQNSFLFQVIWTLQMPLFIIISGYVTRYSQPITNGVTLLKFIKKRSLAYLFPWVIWTYIIRGVIFGQSRFFDFKYLFWHMDSGYWFLITIWSISMIYAISDYVANRVTSQVYRNIMLHFFFCGVGMLSLVLLSINVGLDFFSIKLTLYYLPFYLLGFLYGRLQDWMHSVKSLRIIAEIVIAGSFSIWLFLILRYDFYSGNDSILFIISRFCTSFVGCVSVISLLANLNKKQYTEQEILQGGGFVRGIQWFGVHSLEIYLIHGLSLCILKMQQIPVMGSIESWILIVLNFIITISLSYFYIRVIESNRLLNKLLFWK